MPADQPIWKPGDQVIHPSKPEWGVGSVTDARPSTHEGAPCQRVTVRFDKTGLKTISTAFAKLKLATQAPPQPSSGVPAPGSDPIKLFCTLPEEATDPFRPALSRLKSTLDAYGHTPEGPGLFIWATAQSGLRDPLAAVNRHELEELFQRFGVELDRQLLKLARELSREELKAAGDLADASVPAAQRAWRSATSRR